MVKPDEAAGLFGGLSFGLPHLRLPFRKTLLATAAPTLRNVRGGIAPRQTIGADEALRRTRPAIFSIMIKVYPIRVPHHREQQHRCYDTGAKRETDHQKNQDVIQG